MNKEHLIIWIVASIRKHLLSSDMGLPVRFIQQHVEQEPQITDTVQILINGPDFPRIGSSKETYAYVKLEALAKTKVVSTDVYYHTRVKARVADVLSRDIPVLKIGGTDATVYDKSQIGFLRPVPTESLKITPVGVDVPDASLVESVFELKLC
jgi:hypothetical protein